VKIQKDKIVDLSYLQDFSFSELEIDAPGILNIGVLNGNESLKSLSVRGNYSKLYLPAFGTDFPGYLSDTIDLDFLTNLPSLEKLRLGPGIRSLTFLKSLPSIIDLEIEDVNSLNGIESLVSLKRLKIGECASLNGLKPINHLKLESLEFFTTRFNKNLWLDFVDLVTQSVNVEISVEKYKNIPKKRILALQEMEGITDFYFNEDSYWGNSFSFKVNRRTKSK
jgi:hypothetical protein